MTTTNQLLDLTPRTKLRLSEIEKLIRVHRIVVPPLSRRTLIKMCDAGKFEIAPRETNRSPILVYEDSFLAWVKHLDGK